MKTDKDGWTRHRGGNIPTKAVGPIEIKFRDGETVASIANMWIWKHSGDRSDIIAWRLHKREEPATTPLETNYTNPPAVKFDPIALRDAIRKKEQEITDSLATVEKWRSEIQCMHDKLKAEGFALVDVPKPKEDMSNPKNWRKGDLVECISLKKTRKVCAPEGINIGKTYPLRFDGVDSDGCVALELLNTYGEPGIHYKWNSRP